MDVRNLDVAVDISVSWRYYSQGYGSSYKDVAGIVPSTDASLFSSFERILNTTSKLANQCRPQRAVILSGARTYLWIRLNILTQML